MDNKDTKNKENEEQVEKKTLTKPKDYFYPEDHKEKEIKDSDLPINLVKFNEIIGQDFSRKFNYNFFNKEEMLLANANTYQIININTYERKVFHSTEIGGIGAIAIHPEKTFFAIAECGESPNIYIYAYPSLKLYRILRKGTEKGYTTINFNSRGDMLASVGSDPDYNLLIWNWENEAIILKAKAFSQEIFNVQFSSNIEGKLITSGLGHIKFWEMANTFTGLKLQGELGKFGQIDLSDVSAFVEYPDGKVLSGTEYGTFLLWEGIFIKTHLMIEEKNICHKGPIEYMQWDSMQGKFIPNFSEKFTEEATAKIRLENRNNEEDYFENQEINNRIAELISKIVVPEKANCILTGGHDGYLRWWINSDIENAQGDDNYIAYIHPMIEKFLENPETKQPVKIINLVKNEDFWVVQDANGYLLKLDFVFSEEIPNDFQFDIKIIYNFSSGPIVKVRQLSPSPYFIVLGSDSKTFLYNLKAENFLYEKVQLQSDLEIMTTCCNYVSRETDKDPIIMALGYDIGVLRIYQFDADKMKLNLLTQLRAHEEEIKKILFSPDKSYLMTITKTEIFIFIIDDFNKIIPFCSVKKTCNIIDADWHVDSKRFLLGLSDGSVEEIEIPLNFDNSKSFLMQEYSYKKFYVKLAESQIEKNDDKSKRRKHDEKKVNEPQPSAIISVKYINMYNEGDFLMTAKSPFNEFLYLCNFQAEFFDETEDTISTTPRPSTFWKLPKVLDYTIGALSKNFICLFNAKGHIQIRHKEFIDKFVEFFPNSIAQTVTDICLSEDEKLISIAYKDGTTINYGINKDSFCEIISSIKQNPYDFNPANLNLNQDEIKPGYEFLMNPKEIINEIKANEYDIDPSKVKEGLKREELEELISLEKEKKDAEEQEKIKKADETKNQTRQKIKRLRDEFQKIISQNSGLYEEIRLTEEELIVDDVYLDHLKKNHTENLEDIKHKYDWQKANVHITIDKIKSFFLDSVKTTKIYVFALETNLFVNTIRCPNLPGDFKEKLESLNLEISDLQRRIDFDVLENEYKKYIPNEEINKKENSQNTENILNKIRSRINDYHDGENENDGAVKSAESNKNSIKEELEYTEENYSELIKLISDKKSTKEKIANFINDQKDQNKKNNKRGKVNTIVDKNIRRCPDSYYLKINNDKIFNETNMLSVLLHKKRVYDFLGILYEERESFNTKVINLRKKKIDLIKKLKDLKAKLIEINTELESEETFEWLEFSLNELLEFPEKEFQVQEKELANYVESRSKENKEILNIYKKLQQTEEEIDLGKKETTEGVLLFKDRLSKKKNENEIESEYRSINLIKLEYKKTKLLNECKKLIKDFDTEVLELRKINLTTSFKQKLGEFELLIKHEEYSILRAFDSDDMVLIKKLEDLCYDVNENCNNLKNCHEGILSNEEALDKASQGRDAKVKEFYTLISQEKESKAKLEKIFYQKSKRSEAKDNDDKIDNEDDGEDSRPKNIQQQLYSEIINLKDLRENYDADIEKLKKSITLSKKTRDHLIATKFALDRRRDDIRGKINSNEKKKCRYLNLIDITIPLKLDKFSKFEAYRERPKILKLSLDISKGVLISDFKSLFLENLLVKIKEDNQFYESEIDEFKNKFISIDRDIKDVTKKKNDFETIFKNEQILKFGIVIKFENLLKASKDTIVDKLEGEYKNMKRDVDLYIDRKKYDLENSKKELQELIRLNTDFLTNIKELLEKNKKFDITLEEKNNEINQKDGRKYSMYNIKEKKLKLKEILNLLEQQMKALKKEIDIFRKKGGHIYSTIISNLN